MNKLSAYIILAAICLFAVALSSCTQKKVQVGPALFEVLKEDETNLHFSNNLKPTPEFNMLKYMYYFNGAGVAAGDFNNDGRIDLFFASNQGQNSMYLNEGNMQFKDVTKEAQIPVENAWSTGVNVVDINNDSLPDLYICRVGNF